MERILQILNFCTGLVIEIHVNPEPSWRFSKQNGHVVFARPALTKPPLEDLNPVDDYLSVLFSCRLCVI